MTTTGSSTTDPRTTDPTATGSITAGLPKNCLETPVYKLYQADSPLLISMPHAGTKIPQAMKERMTPEALRLADTDWYLPELYQFAFGMNVNLLIPEYSRYVIDLNRPKSDESLYPGADTTGLCPDTTFAREPVYQNGQEVSAEEKAERIADYWQPYHQQLADWIALSRARHSRAFILEAHSIASVVPRFFEGKLPDFNFGTYDHHTVCPAFITQLDSFETGQYSRVVNGRFKGGYITRAYAAPDKQTETLQLELSQATYMNEDTLQFDERKAEQVRPYLKALVEKIIAYLA